MLRTLLAAFVTLAVAVPAWAHPHVWVTMRTELVYAPDGKITGIRHAWSFDDMFSTFATQGLESKQKGKFTREELAPLAKVNVESLKEFDYFTYATADGKKSELAEPAPGYWLDYANEVLTLNFTLPFKKPVSVKELKVEIYDPTYFVDFQLEEKDPVALSGAPANCSFTLGKPQEMTKELALKLNEIPADGKIPENTYGSVFANKIFVKCQ